MKDLVKLIVTELVEDKEAVGIIVEENDGEIDIKINVAEKDKGKVIGRGGNIINSIRNIARACAVKEDVKVNIRIWE